MQSREESGAKMTIFMSRKELIREINHLREFLLELKQRTPHKWLRAEIEKVIRNEHNTNEKLRDEGIQRSK